MPLTLGQLEGFFTNGALAAAGGAAVSIPIVIHLLTRLRRRPQAWGAMRFIMQAYRRHRTRLQLEQIILLLVRCLVLAVLGFALAGPLVGGWASGVGIDAGGRLVCLVVDDALSSRVAEADGRTRFERLRRAALRVLEQLGPSDRVSLWRGGRPGGPIVATGTLDHAAIKRELEAMTPRFSRSDLTDTLALISRSLVDQGSPKDRTFVVLLSDLSHGTLPVDRPAPPDLVKLGEQARLLAARPAAAAANVQVEVLQPRRRMVLAAGTDAPAAVPVAVKLRRFEDASADTVTHVKLSLLVDASTLGAGGASTVELASDQVQHHWAAGQHEAVINKDVLVPPEVGTAVPGAAGGVGAGTSVIITAEVDADRLADDNRRFATVELRRRLLIGLVDDRAQRLAESPAGFTPERWLTFALAPQSSDGLGATPMGGIELAHAPAATLHSDATGAWDVAMVLRPDLLGPDGWAAVRKLVLRGGVAWLFVPPEGVSSSWTEAAPRELGRDWTLGLEPIEAGKGAAAEVGPASPDAAAPSAAELPGAEAAAWQLATDVPTPEPLRLLSADWQNLLAPIRVMKRLDVQVRGGTDEAWLQLADKGRSPFLVVSGMGEGSLVLLGTAIDPAWTNLPTKPLFVPLLHETLRGLLGQAGQNAQEQVCGDEPVLSLARWEGAQQLVLQLGPPRAGEEGDAASRRGVLLQRRNEGFVPVAPLDVPGVYVGAPGMSARKLAVNVDAAGGDTRALDEAAVEAFFTAVGQWRWLDEANPAASLLAYTTRANIGWPLLWMVLALVVVELCLARWFSHAHGGSAERAGAPASSGAASMLARAAERVRGGER